MRTCRETDKPEQYRGVRRSDVALHQCTGLSGALHREQQIECDSVVCARVCLFAIGPSLLFPYLSKPLAAMCCRLPFYQAH